MSASIFKLIVRIDANQTYPYSMRRPMATRTYTWWGQDLQTSRVPPGENKIPSFENIVKSYFERPRPDCKIETSIQQAESRKLTALVLMFFVLIATQCSKDWAAFTTLVPLKIFDRLSLKRTFNVVIKKENSMIWEEAIFAQISPLSLNWWSVKVETVYGSNNVKRHIQDKFLDRSSLAAVQILEEERNTKIVRLRSMRHWTIHICESQFRKLRSNLC